jgi:hypothetical protein
MTKPKSADKYFPDLFLSENGNQSCQNRSNNTGTNYDENIHFLYLFCRFNPPEADKSSRNMADKSTRGG